MKDEPKLLPPFYADIVQSANNDLLKAAHSILMVSTVFGCDNYTVDGGIIEITINRVEDETKVCESKERRSSDKSP